MADEQDYSIVELTASIVGAYVEKNRLPASGLSELIASVHASLVKLGNPLPEPAPLVPAVNPKKSVQRDFIICLEDGRKFKSLKRHLASQYGMTPDEYRAKWGLASDYPMVAPGYSETRSALAKQLGLGRKPEPVKPAPTKGRKPKAAAAAPVAESVPAPAMAEAAPAKPRGRRAKQLQA